MNAPSESLKPDSLHGKVADAVPNTWVYRLLPQSVWPYAQLARWDRPIGSWLLMWPCWWALALAIGALMGSPDIAASWSDYVLPLGGAFAAFLLGAIAMRGAGCTYNDLVDHELDAQVARTASRPMPSGRVSRTNAKLFIAAQMAVGAGALLYLTTFKGYLNTFAGVLALASLVVVALYPFAKRFTNWPQFVLGLSFSWGALMGWAVIFDEIHLPALALYAGSICWVIGYDTIYAHQDAEDDALIGIKSTALLFGDKTKLALVVLYSAALALFALAFSQAYTGWPAYAGLAVGGAHMIWQLIQLDIEDADNCLRLFKSNGQFGWILFAGLMAAIVV
ncbi:4-hydroxybenzoate octaprenyltransferase [Pseudahrensia aquimaris]|uniref:4-hydroxybenzoate octaprenyltransferase n=1 Tax=Pseudahrensia aquimaris TaxID=744461 RepID=A0ABW3FDX0_9HYPH